MILTAPVAGTVQELAVTTLGGVVTPAQALMTVVPEEQDLRVEVWIENKDVGFVHEGQAAEVKVEAFPFTEHGLIHGTIVAPSRDAVERVTLSIEGRTVRLTPGMAVQADIKSGKRRVIDDLLGPVMKAKRESLQER